MSSRVDGVPADNISCNHPLTIRESAKAFDLAIRKCKKPFRQMGHELVYIGEDELRDGHVLGYVEGRYRMNRPSVNKSWSVEVPTTVKGVGADLMQVDEADVMQVDEAPDEKDPGPAWLIATSWSHVGTPTHAFCLLLCCVLFCLCGNVPACVRGSQ
jgi:hypothetical protein